MAPKVNKFAIQHDFPVSVEVFRKLFFEKDGTFERTFHETIRMDSEVVMSDWENDTRTKTYKPNVKILGGMKVNGTLCFQLAHDSVVVSKETQTRKFVDGKLTIIQEVTTLSVGTTSISNSIWVVSNVDKGCRVDASTEVKMTGPFFIVTDGMLFFWLCLLMAAELCKSATGQVRESVQKWFDAAQKHIVTVGADMPAPVVPSAPPAPAPALAVEPPVAGAVPDRPLERAAVSVYETEADETAPCRPSAIVADTSSVTVERDPSAPRDPDIPPLDEDSVIGLDRIEAPIIHPVRRVSAVLTVPSPSPIMPYDTASLTFSSTATTPLTAPTMATTMPVSPTVSEPEQSLPGRKPRTEKHLLLLLTLGLGVLLIAPLLLGRSTHIDSGSVQGDIGVVQQRISVLEAEISGLQTRLSSLTQSLRNMRAEAADAVGSSMGAGLGYGMFGWLMLAAYYSAIAVAVLFVLRFEVPYFG